MDGWRGGVVKYKVNYLTLSRYEEAHRRLNIDALASEGKMKGEALPSLRLFNNEFGPSDSRIFSRSSPSPASLISFERVQRPRKKKDRLNSRVQPMYRTFPRNDMFIYFHVERILTIFSNCEGRRFVRVHDGKEEKR